MKMPRSWDRGTFAGRATIAGSKVPQTLARGRCPRVELKRKTVHAVAQAGRLRTVVENVAEMTAATAAMNFGAQHTEGAILMLPHGILQRLPEARPSSAAFVFRLRGEQRQVAAGTGKGAFAVLLEQRAGVRALGA